MIFRVACLLTVSSASPQEVPEGSEQTGLLQKIHRGEILINQGSEDRTRLTKLFESTSQLLRSGTTPAVINFTNDVLKEIQDSALPAITDSSKADQNLLDGSIASFIPIQDHYKEKMDEFEKLRLLEGETSENHKACRQEETESCGIFSACTTQLQHLWQNYALEKGQFEDAHKKITRGICPTAEPWGTFPKDWKVGTEYKKEPDGNYTWEYRTHIESYIREGQEYFEAKDAYEAHNKTCVIKKTALEAKTRQCDALKINLERDSCTSKSHHTEWQDVFDVTWKMAQVNLVRNTNNAMQQEEDRKKEYQSIKSVQCLLERINSTGGMPCDDKVGNGTADAQIAQCRIIDINTTWLNLSYLDEPARPIQTPLPPHPCEQSFVDNEYLPMLDQDCGNVNVGDDELTKDPLAWVVNLRKPICDAKACPIVVEDPIVTTTLKGGNIASAATTAQLHKTTTPEQRLTTTPAEAAKSAELEE